MSALNPETATLKSTWLLAADSASAVTRYCAAMTRALALSEKAMLPDSSTRKSMSPLCAFATQDAKAWAPD